MARIETTGGDVYYTIPNCDCGLTGGCEKCQPLKVFKEKESIYPCTREGEFLAPDLVEFYRKRQQGLIIGVKP